MLCAGEVWADALNRPCFRDRLLRVLRTGAFLIVSVYRTVPEPAFLVIAGVIPVHNLTREGNAI